MAASIRISQGPGTVPLSAGALLILLALCLSGCGGNRGSNSTDGKQNEEAGLRQAVTGKWAIISDNPGQKETTLEVTPDKWIWNNPASKAPTTITYLYALSGDRLELTAVSQFKSSPIKTRLQVSGNIMTTTTNMEENKHLYGQEKGEVVTKYKRIK
jgi:hypothetical protein